MWPSLQCQPLKVPPSHRPLSCAAWPTLSQHQVSGAWGVLMGWVFGGGRVAGWGSLMMGGLMENCILRRCVGGFEWKM